MARTQPSDQLAIFPADWRDLRPLIALERMCFARDAWSFLDILAALTFPETVRLKAERGGKLIGFVLGDRRERQGMGWIATLAVHPEYRRRGVGALLLETCERELATPCIRLTLRRSNTPALRLYQRAGYAEVAVWPGYYRDHEDGLVMEKRMNEGHGIRS